jgi:maltose O-acetyltransferase
MMALLEIARRGVRICVNLFDAYLVRLRSAYFTFLFGKCGANLIVYGRVVVYSPGNITIGKGCCLNEGVILNATGSVIDIADHVTISPGAMLQCGVLTMEGTENLHAHQYAPINIGNGVWIASGAHILAGVTVGDFSVVGANSVVTHSVPVGVFVAGVPARVIREIKRGEK